MAVWNRDSERRQRERFQVQWQGTLTCLFPNHEEKVDVKISEISATGARLELETLKLGPYHIVVGSEQSRFTLNVSLPEGVISTSVRIVWYSMDEEKLRFNVGVLFPETSETNQAEIERILREQS
ncbi:MAG: PilZ domain-containing protein [Syntrophobacteraceae bacterium]